MDNDRVPQNKVSSDVANPPDLTATTIEALLYTQEGAHDPNRGSKFFFNELFVGFPYHLLINWGPLDMWSPSKLNIRSGTAPRLEARATFSDTPHPVTNVQTIRVSKDWVDQCAKAHELQTQWKQVIQTLSKDKPSLLVHSGLTY